MQYPGFSQAMVVCDAAESVWPPKIEIVVAAGIAAIFPLVFSRAEARRLIWIMHMDDGTGKRCRIGM
jgi:hypothetical protein